MSQTTAAMSAPDAVEARTYRQSLPAGRRPIRICLLLLIAWAFAGAVVFWILAGPGDGRVGRGVLGFALWFGPIVLLAVPVVVGPRGPFREWFWPRLIVRIDDTGLAWWTEGAVRRAEDTVAWSAVASVHPTEPTRDRPPGADCALAGADGRVLARLPCRLVRIDRPVEASRSWRRVAWLPDVAVAVRPDRYRRRRALGRPAVLREPGAD